MPKPTAKPNWTSDGDPAKISEPTTPKKLTGWLASEKPSHLFMNWLFYNLSQWVDYLDEIGTAVEGYSAAIAGIKAEWDAIVGADTTIRTHATLQAAHDAVNPGARILVLDSEALAARVSITKANIEVVFKPGVTYSKGSDTIALDVTGAGFRCRGGRFAGFSAGGDVAIRFGTTADFGMVRDARFSNNATDVQDLTPNSTVSVEGIITE